MYGQKSVKPKQTFYQENSGNHSCQFFFSIKFNKFILLQCTVVRQCLKCHIPKDIGNTVQKDPIS